MKIRIAPEIENQPELAEKAHAASALLERQLGPSAENARVDWTIRRDEHGRGVLILMLSDWTGAVGYPFAPDELDNEPHLRNRLHRLWGDFLQVRSHTQLDSRLGNISEPVGS